MQINEIFMPHCQLSDCQIPETCEFVPCSAGCVKFVNCVKCANFVNIVNFVKMVNFVNCVKFVNCANCALGASWQT